MDIKLNGGIIFKNDFKEKDTQPDYKGKINIDGKTKEIALWVNKPEGKKSYFSVMVSDEYVKPVESEEVKPEPEDLPF